MPVFTNSQQVTLVLQSLLLGVGIGAVYDMLRALRLHFRCGWAGAALLDTLFWAIVLAALFEFGLIAAAGQPRGFVLLTAAGGMGLYFAALSETVLEAIMRLLQALAKLRRAIYGLRMHCQTVVKQRCSPVKIRFLTKMYGDNVIEKHGINRDRTGDREKTRCLCGKQGIFTRDRALIRPGFIRQLETRASTRSASFFHALASPGRPGNGGGASGAYQPPRGEKP